MDGGLQILAVLHLFEGNVMSITLILMVGDIMWDENGSYKEKRKVSQSQTFCLLTGWRESREGGILGETLLGMRVISG